MTKVFIKNRSEVERLLKEHKFKGSVTRLNVARGAATVRHNRGGFSSRSQ